MPTLLLVDGSSYLYRAYHAMPDLRNAAGAPTGAIYGVINMMKRLRDEYPADFHACVFDAKGKTFRDDWYPDYKATRAPMPDDLRLQIAPIHAAVKALGWPILMLDGVEADDVIGTLCVRASAAGIKTIVSTGDKDMAQLVDAHVTLVNTMSNETLDPPGVAAKFGVPPNRIVDYLTLIGDTVDNVPGVDKVGPKTAVKWLAEFGSLDGVVAAAPSIKGVVGENLRKALDWLPMGRKLVTIKTNVDDVPPVETLGLGETHKVDNDALRKIYSEFGLRSWLRELGGVDGADSPKSGAGSSGSSDPADEARAATLFRAMAPDATPDKLFEPVTEYETILTDAQLDAWLTKLIAAPLAAVDTETTSLEPLTATIVGVSFAVEPFKAAYLPLAHRYQDCPAQLPREAALEKLRPWLENAAYLKVGQNLKYDSHVFANHGITLRGVAHDTLLQSYVLESHRTHDMDALALRHLARKTISFAEVAGKGVNQLNFEQVSIEVAARYSAEDAEVTMHLHQTLYPLIAVDEKLARIYQIELDTQQALITMERNGVLLDGALLAAQSHELGGKLMALEQKAYAQAGQPFNLNSPKQIGEILFGSLKLPVKRKTATGQPSTDEDVLEELAQDFPLPRLLLDYRSLSKLKSTYTDKLPKMVRQGAFNATGRVHTNYAQAVAVTGRLASNDPNLQNIPIRTAEGRRIREAFIAPPGAVILSADYSQIELRIMAHLSQDASLLRAFAQGEDVHRATAAEIFSAELAEVTSEQRRYAKVINFGLIYGMSAFGLAASLGIERSAAKAYIDRYFTRYPGVANYMHETRESAHRDGYVETVFGRRLWLTEINAKSAMRRQGAERAAINAPMQGTAADLIKLAMVAVQRWLEADGLRSKLIMQVHDELVLEVVEAELETVRAQVPKLMSEVAKLDVPLLAEVGVGPNWDRAH